MDCNFVIFHEIAVTIYTVILIKPLSSHKLLWKNESNYCNFEKNMVKYQKLNAFYLVLGKEIKHAKTQFKDKINLGGAYL